MPSESATPLALEFHPVTPERWQDLETLFGKTALTAAAGAHGGEYHDPDLGSRWARGTERL